MMCCEGFVWKMLYAVALRADDTQTLHSPFQGSNLFPLYASPWGEQPLLESRGLARARMIRLLLASIRYMMLRGVSCLRHTATVTGISLSH